MSILIAVSGCGGGDRGPQGVYHHLQELNTNPSLKILALDTTADSVPDNVEKVSKLALSQLASCKDIYLVGHSMGGAVAAMAAQELSQKAPGSVKGIVLINTQTDGLRALKELSIPVLFYHGKEDQYFPLWQIESLYKSYSGPKRMLEIENLDHDLAPTKQRFKSKDLPQNLARDLLCEVTGFFFSDNPVTADTEAEIVSRPMPVRQKSSFLASIMSKLFNKNAK